MNVLICHISAASAWPPNFELELHAMAEEFPGDTYHILSLDSIHFRNEQFPSNVRMIPIKTQWHREWMRYRLLAGGIARVAKKAEIDVIWSINIGLYHRIGIPQVINLRNAFQVYPWAVASFYLGGRVRLAAMRHFFRKSLRHSDGVLVQTPLMAEYVRQLRHAPPHIAVIPKAVESEEDVPIEVLPAWMAERLDAGLGRGAFTFVYAAAQDMHKNHAVLVAAMEKLRRENVKARVVVTISEDELYAATGAAARSLVAGGHLLPLGHIGKEHLRTLYEACDGCAMPSLLESLSSAHLEAMLWRKPQVCADLAYARDLCGDAAVYAQPTDAADWADKMLSIIKNSALRERLVVAGIARMSAYPRSWHEVVHSTRSFLALVAGKE